MSGDITFKSSVIYEKDLRETVGKVVGIIRDIGNGQSFALVAPYGATNGDRDVVPVHALRAEGQS